MPSVQQTKNSILGFLVLFVIFTQIALQIHISYNSENKDTDESKNDQSRLSSRSSMDNSEGSRLKRSLSKHELLEISDNSLTATLQKPEGTIPPPLTLTTAKISLSSSNTPSISLSSSFPSITSLGPENLSKHVTDWTAVSKHLFINQYYFGNFSSVNKELCNKKKNLTLLILVTSAIDHFEQRNAVRQTWGHFALRSDVQFGFVLGDSLLYRYNESVRTAFQTERSLYDDFVIGSFEDTYRNLTIKTLHMLDWISNYCPTAKYFLKTDDDMFLNVPEILRHIDKFKDEDELVPKIYGHVFSGHLPNRDYTHRHSVKLDVYPYTLTYPNFTSGPAYLMSTKIVRPLFEEVLKLPFIPLEDVLTTGFAAMNLGIPRVDITGFHNEMKNPSDFTACELINICAGMTDGSAVQMNYVWFNYIMGKTLCTWKSSLSNNNLNVNSR